MLETLRTGAQVLI